MLHDAEQFFHKMLYNYCSKFLLECFVPKNGVLKNEFLIVFFQVIWLGGTYFVMEFFSEKAKHRNMSKFWG